ncbi:MAG: PIN domain-containing protein [Phycisphaeraceae bacterium]
MILIDTGYLIAILRPADELHWRAVAWSQAVHDHLIVTEHVLWETINQLSAPAERPIVHRMLAEIRTDRSCQIIYASGDLFEAGIRLHEQRRDKAWSLTDCISFQVMQEYGITSALAFDHHYEQAGFDPLLRRDP